MTGEDAGALPSSAKARTHGTRHPNIRPTNSAKTISNDYNYDGKNMNCELFDADYTRARINLPNPRRCPINVSVSL